MRSRRVCVCVSGFSNKSVRVGQMPLKGASTPCSFPCKKAARTWTNLLAVGGGSEEKPSRELAHCSPCPEAVGGAGGDGRTNSPGPSGADAVATAAPQVIVSWKRVWEKGLADKVVGGETVHKPFSISTHNSVSTLFDLVTLS